MLTHLLLILGLILASAFLSLAEISLAAARKARLAVLAEDGNEAARRVLKLQQAPGRFVTVVQIGLNAIAILGGIVGDQAFSPLVERTLAPWVASPQRETVGFLVSFGLVTALFVLFADLMPKRIALVRPESVAMRLARPMQALIWLLAPVVWVFDGLATQLFRLLGLPHARADDITPADIVAMADAGAAAGELLPQEQQMITNVFELDVRLVTSVMTLRDSIVFLKLGESDDSIRAKVSGSPHSKFPVCRDGIDSVIGYVSWKDILARVLAGKPLTLRTEPVVRTVLVIPATLKLVEALERLRDAREDFALVVNEYALVVGLVTLEDVMSTVMGELATPPEEALIVRRDDHSWLIDGATPIEDVMAALAIDSFEGFENYETMAGFLMYTLRKVPRRTDAVTYAGWKFEVVDIDNYRIDQVLATRA